MLFAIMLGTIIGGAGVTLLRQWAVAAFEADERGPVLTPDVFPRLAPPSPLPRYTPRVRRHAV